MMLGAICAPASAAGDDDAVRGRCPDGRVWTYDSADTSRMLSALNEVRRKARRPPLVRHATLDRMAQIHSADMACRNYFNHRTPERRGLKEKLARASAGRPPAFERLAEVIGTSDTPPRQVDRWLGSRSHRRAVLDGAHAQVGIGLVRIAKGSRYTTYWTVELMHERSDRRDRRADR
jgi:uncharacterized protein YkwD